MENVNLQKRVHGIATYKNIIDTEFTEFVVAVPKITEEQVSVERFFELYEQLFFDIPVEGTVNSHQYLVNTSTQYIGGQPIDPEKAALIEEINALRQQILELGDALVVTNSVVK